MKSWLMVLTAILYCANEVHAGCRLPSEKLLQIARADQADDCKPVTDCEFLVMDKKKVWGCEVQVWGGPKGSVQLAGNFVTLVISNAGVVVRRVPGA